MYQLQGRGPLHSTVHLTGASWKVVNPQGLTCILGPGFFSFCSHYFLFTTSSPHICTFPWFFLPSHPPFNLHFNCIPMFNYIVDLVTFNIIIIHNGYLLYHSPFLLFYSHNNTVRICLFNIQAALLHRAQGTVQHNENNFKQLRTNQILIKNKKE